jgi:hypothetical protein
VVVHRRGDDHRTGRRERRAGQQVVGQAVGELGDRVRARGRDEERVGVGDELEVAERLVVRWALIAECAAGRVALELVRQDRSARRTTSSAL